MSDETLGHPSPQTGSLLQPSESFQRRPQTSADPAVPVGVHEHTQWWLLDATELGGFYTTADNQNEPYLTPRKTGSERSGDLPGTAPWSWGIRDLKPICQTLRTQLL